MQLVGAGPGENVRIYGETILIHQEVGSDLKVTRPARTYANVGYQVAGSRLWYLGSCHPGLEPVNSLV